MPIRNAGNLTLSQQPAGTTPDVSGAMQDYFQPLVFEKITRAVVGFESQESTQAINCQGVWQPFTARQLFYKPEGQRAWSWFLLNADLSCVLDDGDICLWRGKQTRVMSRKDFGLYGYVQYELVQDWLVTPQGGVTPIGGAAP
jgi:hypothetical protein